MSIAKYIVFVFVLCALPNIGQALDALEPGESGVVQKVVDGNGLVLDSGLRLRLTGIDAPNLPLDRPGFPTWPLGPEAKDYLLELVEGKTVVLGYGGAKRDRHGRALAQTFRADGLWLQGAMVEAGFARVYTFKDNRSCISELLELEQEARENRRGIWALPLYQIRSVAQTFKEIGTFQIVEGRILETASVRDTTYLNFGEDYRTDFTLTIAKRDRKSFDEMGPDLLALKGERVRIRGWLSDFNGPSMKVTHPEQIEWPLDVTSSVARQNGAKNATISPCSLRSLTAQ